MGDPQLDPGLGKSAIKDTLEAIRESDYGLETRWDKNLLTLEGGDHDLKKRMWNSIFNRSHLGKEKIGTQKKAEKIYIQTCKER